MIMDEIVTLAFTQAQLKTINDGLVLLPYWRAHPLFVEINTQMERTKNEIKPT